MASSYTKSVVSALAKLENLNANHNPSVLVSMVFRVVSALAKIEKSKAIHNAARHFPVRAEVVS